MILLPFYNYLFFAMFRNSVSVIFPELKIELSVSEPLLGVLITVELLTSLLTNFAAIPLERRFGRRGTCVLGLFLCFLGVLFFSFSGTYLLALIYLAIVGAGQGDLCANLLFYVRRRPSEKKGYYSWGGE